MTKLINSITRQEIKPGDEVFTFRDEKATLESHDGRRVYCKKPGSDMTWQWFPSVIGAEFVTEEAS